LFKKKKYKKNMLRPSRDFLFYTLAIPTSALVWWGYRDSFNTFGGAATQAKNFLMKALPLPQKYPHISYDGLSMRMIYTPPIDDKTADADALDKKDKHTGFPQRRL